MKGEVYPYQTKTKGKKWGYVHDLPKVEGKKRNQKRVTGFATEREASQALRKSITDLERGRLELSNLTVGNVIEYYLTYTENEGGRAKGTISNYKGAYKNHLQGIKNLCVKKLKQTDVQEWVRQMHDKGIGDNAYNICLKLLKASFNYAIDVELINTNPFRRLKARTIPKKHHNRFTIQEIVELVKICEKYMPEYYCLFILSVVAGMRPCEYTAITTRDIDYQHKQININKVITRSEIRYDEAKTPFSIRTVNVSDGVIDIINCHINTYGIKDGDFLFRADKGGLLYAKWVERKFEKLLILGGYNPKFCRLYDLRGQYVDIMHYLDVPTEYISKQVGHSNSVITSRVYSEILQDIPVEANKRIDDLFFKN